jgi:hypothetical protein
MYVCIEREREEEGGKEKNEWGKIKNNTVDTLQVPRILDESNIFLFLNPTLSALISKAVICVSVYERQYLYFCTSKASKLSKFLY